MNSTGNNRKQTAVVRLPVLGCLRLSSSGKGITGITFVNKRTALKKPSAPIMVQAIRELRSYARGSLKVFSVPVDMSGVPAFTKRVLYAARQVRYGKTASYGQIASAVGNGRACRAVGGALGRNPVPVIIPCHRIIRADGTIGGFRSGEAIKRRLLAREGIVPPGSTTGKP